MKPWLVYVWGLVKQWFGFSDVAPLDPPSPEQVNMPDFECCVMMARPTIESLRGGFVHGFRLEITSLEDFIALCAIIRGEDTSALTARLSADAKKIDDAAETLGEASSKLGGLSPEPSSK